MTHRFEDLVDGSGLSPEERRRLERAHELLVTAGAPAEITAALALPPAPPAPVVALSPVEHEPASAAPRKRFSFGWVAVAAAAAVAAACLALGFVVGDRLGGTLETERVVAMAGEGATGSLRIGVPDEAGNRTLEFSVEGLPAHAERGYYELFLEDEGEPGLPCGGFRLVEGGGRMTFRFPVPYNIDDEDRWVVTTIVPREIRWPGEIVMRTTS